MLLKSAHYPAGGARHNPGMTQKIGDLHVYLREIKDDERTSLSVLSGLISPGATVLDLGTGSGALGQYLRETRQCTVDGVTFNEEEAAHARPHYRRLEVADLDNCDLVQMFGGMRYDAIVCADVLEHLRNPTRILDAARTLLTPQGQVLISIPNAAYCGLIGELMLGEFRYREEGLLDGTHLRFFTRRSLSRFLQEAGWSLEGLEEIRRELAASEFKVAFDNLPPAVARYLLARPDSLTYQFIARTRPAAEGAAPGPLPPGPEDGRAVFTAELYLGRDGRYDEASKLTAIGTIGEPRQTLRFALPAGAGTTQLRLDPADRPGFLHLHALTLRGARDEVLWRWDGGADGLGALLEAQHQQMVLSNNAMLPDAAMVLLHGEDPWIELPIPPQTTRAACALEVELGWPMSADYLALSGSVTPLAQRIEELRRQAAADHAEHERTLEHERREALHALQQERAETASVSQQRVHLAEQNKLLQEQRRGLSAELNALKSDHHRLVGEFDQLATHLRWIEQSTVFRATRPVVKAKMWLQQQLKLSAGRGTAEPRDAQPVTPPAQPVDVIVPVYRGLEDTRRCVESVLAQNCRTPLRLIVINDASPEPEVTQWLRSMAGQDSRYLLVENEQNLGFVGTVNRGMALSEAHDVVLLNSDAEVANDWLDRLRRAAYSDARVASVTPFSNNATICSYPRFCQDNALPAGYDTAALDRLFAAANAGQVADVPTGIGFCMYIRRDCLDQVGLFDVETFGKGYGEENDFCLRAAAAGWRNLHALDTFVMHAGGVSFGDAKSPRERAAMETLRRMYPHYEPAIHRFIADDPARGARQAVDLARVRARGLPVVLAVMHDRQGGTLRHVGELAEHLSDHASFFMLAPTHGGVLLRLVGRDEALAMMFRLPEEFDDLVAALRALGVRHIHYHHLLGHGEEVMALPERLGLPFDFTAHDFYALCPQISMTDKRNGYCGEEGRGQCMDCLESSPAPGGMDIDAWRARHGSFVLRARHVLVPSRDAARRFLRYLPQADVCVAPHTDVAADKPLPAPAPRRLPEDAPLKVVVIGALSPIKGADVLEDVAVEAHRRGAPVEFHLLGYAYRNLRTRPKSALSVHGEYDEAELPELLRWLQPDLIWFPAQWPETYSYTLSACLQAGMPVVAPDLGAFPERLSGRKWTWLRPWNTPAGEWLRFFEDLRERHFVTGTSPSPYWAVAPHPGTEALIQDWDYARDYLTHLDRLPPTPPTEPLTREFIAAHQPDRTDLPGQTGLHARRGLLRMLVRLRSAPGLRGVARAIPLRVQTRIKSWLST